jgi:uncharacterized protein involved in exopolysaccharide biosynthesis
MAFISYVRVLRQHVGMLVLLCACATVAGYFLTYLIDEKYEARALVLVKPNINVKLTSKAEDKELLHFPIGAAMPKVEIPSNTYIEIIKSRVIAERIVTDLDMGTVGTEAVQSSYEKLLNIFMRTMRKAFYVTVQLLKHGRVMAQPSSVEAAIEAIQNNISLKAIKDAYQFEIKYSADAPDLAAKVANAAADHFLAYMADINIADANKTLAFLRQRLHEREVQMGQAREAMREAKVQHNTITFKDEAVEEIKIIAALEKDYERSDVKLVALLEEFTPSHPRVKATKAERGRLQSSLQDHRARLNALPDKERQLSMLSLDLQVAEEIYQLIKKEYEEAEIRVGKDLSEIKVISPAVPPVYPSRPIRFKYAIISFVIALLMGIGAAFVLDHLNRSLQSIEDVERALQLRVLATLPRL